MVKAGAASLQMLGLQPGDCVSMFSENSYKWLVLDQAIMKAGAYNSVRGASAPMDELDYIYENSNSSCLVVENIRLLREMASSPQWKRKPKFVVILYDDENIIGGRKDGGNIASLGEKFSGVDILSYEELILTTDESSYRPLSGVDGDSTATILYTPGTTKKPKGVILTHNNLLHQVKHNTFSTRDPKKWNPNVGDTVVSILPCWHIYERTSEYFCFARGVQQVYSNLGKFKSDLVHWQPHYLFAVPRLFETIHKGVKSKFRKESVFKQKLLAAFTSLSLMFKRMQRIATNTQIYDKQPNPITNLAKKALASLACCVLYPLFKVADHLAWRKVRANLGGRLKVATSGGSLLPLHIEKFFQMIGLNVIVGFGLTESSPIILSRYVESNVIGSVGKPGASTDVKIVNVNSDEEVTPGQVGILKARGPSIFPRYNNNPQDTAAAIDKWGYFNTGDLARLNTATGDYIITGRAKDTIVLSNGENVAPQPIEDQITGSSDLFDQAMLVGQDKAFLVSIVVLNPESLAARGLISETEGRRLSAIIGATPMTTGPDGDVEELRSAARTLQGDARIKDAVMKELSLTNEKTKRGWERVGKAIITLEPFSVVNGQLTQTLKVKRDAVAKRYAEDIRVAYVN